MTEESLTGEDPMVDASPVSRRTYCLQLLIVLETKTRTSVPTVRRLVTVEICRNKSSPKVKLKGPDELKAGNIE